MISEKMQKALNDQIREELESAYIYLAMAAYFQAEGLDGMAGWMKAQSQEEVSHAMKFFGHIDDRQGRVTLQALKEPPAEWGSPLEAFQAAYKHEQHISGCIDKLVKLAEAEGDRAAYAMLQWFVSEQVEEEANAAKIVDRLERVGTSGNGLIMLDHKLGERQAD